MKGIIFYTDNRVEEAISLWVKVFISISKLPIVSCSLKPMDFGENIVLDLKPSIVTMFKQILTALKVSTAKYVFFAEHDLLYHPSHFEFIPSREDTFYFNINNWRWDYPQDRLITYNELKSLSGMCCNRELAIKHYKKRLELIENKGWKETSKEPAWVRKIGYEPGKTKKRGGFSNDKCENWRSEYPNIDIRHKGTQSPPKVTLESFKHAPTGWQETTLDNISEWNLKGMFSL